MTFLYIPTAFEKMIEKAVERLGDSKIRIEQPTRTEALDVDRAIIYLGHRHHGEVDDFAQYVRTARLSGGPILFGEGWRRDNYERINEARDKLSAAHDEGNESEYDHAMETFQRELVHALNSTLFSQVINTSPMIEEYLLVGDCMIIADYNRPAVYIKVDEANDIFSFTAPRTQDIKTLDDELVPYSGMYENQKTHSFRTDQELLQRVLDSAFRYRLEHLKGEDALDL